MHGLAPGLRVSEGTGLPSGAVSTLYGSSCLRESHKTCSCTVLKIALTWDTYGYPYLCQLSRTRHTDQTVTCTQPQDTDSEKCERYQIRPLDRADKK